MAKGRTARVTNTNSASVNVEYRNDDMASEADSLAVIGRKRAAARLADRESPAAQVGVVQAAEGLRAPCLMW